MRLGEMDAEAIKRIVDRVAKGKGQVIARYIQVDCDLCRRMLGMGFARRGCGQCGGKRKYLKRVV